MEVEEIEPYDNIGANVYDVHNDALLFDVWIKPSLYSAEEEEKIAEICRVALNKFCVLHKVKHIQEYIEQLKK